jgi:hypothetical protein
MLEMALFLEDAQERSHCGITGSIRQCLMNLGCRRLSASINDIHDLTLAPAQMMAVSIRHAKFLA